MLRSECWVQKPAARCRSLSGSTVSKILGWRREGIAGKPAGIFLLSIF